MLNPVEGCCSFNPLLLALEDPNYNLSVSDPLKQAEELQKVF